VIAVVAPEKASDAERHAASMPCAALAPITCRWWYRSASSRQILALNTEAHNLKDKSLEVIRIFRNLMAETPGRQRRTFPTTSKSLRS
jgi:hypothetical protein